MQDFNDIPYHLYNPSIKAMCLGMIPGIVVEDFYLDEYFTLTLKYYDEYEQDIVITVYPRSLTLFETSLDTDYNS